MSEDLFSEFEAAIADNQRDDLNVCLSCREKNITLDTVYGTLVCRSCGTQRLSGLIDNSPEWKAGGDSSAGATLNRCSTYINPLLPQTSMATRIVGSRVSSLTKRSHTWGNNNTKEISLMKVFQIFHSVGTKYNLPESLITTAKGLYKMVSEDKVTRGDVRKGVYAACIYYACQKNNIIKSEKEIMEMFNVRKKDYQKECKYLHKLLFDKKKNNIAMNEVITIHGYANNYLIILGISDPRFIEMVNEVVTYLDTVPISNMIYSLAAGAIYYIAVEYFDETPNRIEIATKCDLSEVTVLKCYRNILSYKRELDLKIKKKYNKLEDVAE